MQYEAIGSYTNFVCSYYIILWLVFSRYCTYIKNMKITAWDFGDV